MSEKGYSEISFLPYQGDVGVFPDVYRGSSPYFLAQGDDLEELTEFLGRVSHESEFLYEERTTDPENGFDQDEYLTTVAGLADDIERFTGEEGYALALYRNGDDGSLLAGNVNRVLPGRLHEFDVDSLPVHDSAKFVGGDVQDPETLWRKARKSGLEETRKSRKPVEMLRSSRNALRSLIREG